MPLRAISASVASCKLLVHRRSVYEMKERAKFNEAQKCKKGFMRKYKVHV